MQTHFALSNCTTAGFPLRKDGEGLYGSGAHSLTAAPNVFIGRPLHNKWGSPMNEKTQNLQDTFLNAVRKGKTAVTIYLVNGVKLQGNITWFDNFCVLLRRDGQVQLVYKHAISTVMPMGPVQLQEQDSSGAGES